MKFTHVDKPLRIGKSVELKNRIFRPAHGTHFGGGLVNQKLIDYHEARAKGGVALSILEVLAVHPSSPGPLRAYEKGLEESYAPLVDRLKPYGMKLFQQLWHAGHSFDRVDGAQPWSASDIPNPKSGTVPLPMTKAMIAEVVESYAAAAARIEKIGLDGVEVHSAHGYLLHQFLSPSLNRREDEYGGSLENRARLLLDILTAVRAAVSSDFVVGMRVGTDKAEGGLTPDELGEVVKLVEARGLTDYVSISMGSYHAYAKLFGAMHEPMGYEIAESMPIIRAAKSPVLVTGRFRTMEEVDQLIRAGTADVVGMVRATIADPDLVRKTFAGQIDQVRPCIACNQVCVAKPTGVMGCAVNPAVGYEAQLMEDRLERPAAPKKVHVIGGGPAGMEAARVAALRGHRVTLWEAQPNLGGALHIAAKAPMRHSIGDILSWLEREIYRLGVDVRLNSYVTREDILAESPDSVIVATGSAPRMDGIQVANPGHPIPGFEQDHVWSSLDLFTRKLPATAKNAVVIDDLGHYEALAAAEQLIQAGLNVTFVTRHPAVAPMVENARIVEPALSRLDNGHFVIHARHYLASVDSNTVAIRPTYEYAAARPNRVTAIPADLVIYVSANRSNRELFDDLQDAEIDLRVIGDANRPRFLEHAMADGRLAGGTC